METVASASLFGSWDAEVRLHIPRGLSNQRLTLIAPLLFLKSFSACEVLDLCTAWQLAFAPCCSCVMTVVIVALTKMLAVQIV